MNATFKPVTGRFGSSNDDVKKELLEQANAKNTNKATKVALRCLNEYLMDKNLGSLDQIADDDLPEILENFYVAARSKKNEVYHTQTMKGIRAALNRHLKMHRKIDIIDDPRFKSANLIFKGVQKRAKRVGKGVRKSTTVISDADLQSLAGYFRIDHVTSPNPSILQRNVMFNIMYYLCRRGQENLYEMTKDWFNVLTDNQGVKFVMQTADEIDKNHNEEDTQLTNQGRMYEVPGEFMYFN